MKLNRAEKFLADLVAIPSTTANLAANAKALDIIETELRKLGMHIVRRPFAETHSGQTVNFETLVATTQRTKTPRLMLSAHVDVVSGPDRVFTLSSRGGKLTGRGVSDMKFAIAAFLEVAKRLEARLDTLDFGVTIVTNEEIGGRGVENLLKEGFIPKVAVLPDNGSDWGIEKAAKGAWTIAVDAPGRAAHGSRPWNGDSATFRLLGFLEDAKKLFAGQDSETDTLNISRLSGGEAQNQIPASASATLDIRVVGAASLARIKAGINKLCARHGVAWREIAFFPPTEHDMDNPDVRAFKRCLKQVIGTEPTETVSPSACDGVYYANHGVPVIITRPPGGGEHADDEWISREGFSQLVTVLEQFIKTTSVINEERKND